MKQGARYICRLLALIGLLAGLAQTVLAEDGQAEHEPGIELPAGEGKVLLLRACTRCHDLKGLPAYQGYWNRARWQAMVNTMVKNGATLTPDEQEQVVDYLTRHFGAAKR